MRSTCSVNKCDAAVHGHGYCLKHYKRWRNHGDPRITKPTGGSFPQEETAHLRANLDEVAASYESGASIQKLASHYGLARITITKYLRQQGVQIRPPGGRGGPPPMLKPERALKLCATYQNNPALTLDDLATQFGVSRQTARRTLLRHGVKPQPRGGRPNPIPVRDRPPQRKPRQMTSAGYIQIWLPRDHPHAAMCQERGWVLEHRVKMAEKLGRPLTPEETVHHKNGNRQDNRLRNLELRQGKHGNGQSWRCADCGSRNLEAI